ncbi:hypothetical protein IWW50_003639, partial [Coemansia erecta]
ADSNSEEKIQELYDAFDTFDKNGDGVISADELTVMMRSLSKDRAEQDITYMINLADADKDGEIDIQEFKEMVKTMPWLLGSFDSNFLYRFPEFDKDSDGYLSIQELESGLSEMGLDPSNTDIKSKVDALDLSDNANINYHQFSSVVG